MEQKPQVEQNTVENSAQEPALEYVEMTQSTEVSEQQLAMLDVGVENTKDSLEIVEEQDVEKEPETKEEVAEDSPPLEEAVAQESIPASAVEKAPVAVETAKEDTSSESEADDGGISASTWLWGIAGAGALAYALDSDKAAPKAPSISLATDSGTAGDGLTNSGVVNVTGLEDGATWEYSLDGGTTWNAGSGNSVAITNDGSYQVIVRQDNGKVSENSATLNITIDSTSPSLTSETSIANQNENSAVGTVVYTASVEDASDVVFSLKEGSDAALSIDSASGEVSLVASPNFEVATSHAFTVVATDAAGNVTEQALVLNINNLDEVAPTITSGDPLSIGDDVAAGTVVYTVTSDDSADISGGVTYSLKEGSDPALTINASTGEVSLLASPDYQTATSHAFTVVATDAAGNSTEKALLLNIDDKTAPSTILVDGDSAAGTLSLSFSEPMDVTSLPAGSDFVVNQGTSILNVTDVAFNGNQVVLTISGLVAGAVQIEYNGTSLQDASGNALPTFTQVVVSDGYIKGAQVYLDANNDGVATADELLEGVTTDAQGQVILNGAIADGNLIIKGGINTDTGAVNKLTLSAPSGYKVINPLTTLVKAVQSASGSSVTQTEAENVVAKSLGITLSAGETLSNFDPEANASTTGLQAKKAVAQIAVILEAAITSASPGNSEAAETQVAAKLADVLISAQQLAPDTAVTFDATVITEVFKAEDGSSIVSSEASTLVTASVEAITQAATLEEVVVEQAKAMDKIAPLAASVIMDPASDSAALDNVTSETMLNLVVTFAQDDLAGGGVVAGDVLTVTANGVVVGTYTVTTSDVAAGKASWMSAALADGDVAYSVSISDRAGNVSPASNLLSVTIDTTAPSITSADIVSDANENTAIGTVIYTAASSDANADLGLVYSLKAGSDPALTIDAASGEVSLLASPDFETAQSHSFTVVSTDLAGNSSEKALTVNILDIDEVAPTITSSAKASNIDENSGPEQVIYTATATDDADISAGFTFALKEGSPSVLSINAQTGAVTLASDPDHETVSSYDFTIVVTDAAGNSSEQAVSLVINDLDDSAPMITSASTLSVDENTSAGSTLYTATADDSGDDVSGGVTFSLKAGSDSSLSINAETGVVTSSAALDHETQDSYDFTVVATDAAGNVGEQAVKLTVTDLNEAPTSTPISDQVVVTDLAFSSDLSKSFSDQDDGDVLTFALTAGELPSGLSLSEDGVISGTATAEFDAASFTITATDAGGFTKEQTFSLKVVAAPVVESLIVGDSQTPSDAAKLGDVITVELVMSEAFVLDTTGGTPTIGVLFGDSTTEVIGTYALTSGNNLAFTVTAPSGNAESVSLGSISLNGATLVGTLSEQPWETSSVGQSATYILDNAAPVFTSSTTASVDENTAVGSAVYTASVDDVVGGITYSLKPGSDSALKINASSGVVSLVTSPDFETATTHAFTVVATDVLGYQSEQAVTLSVTDLNEAPVASSINDIVAVTDQLLSVNLAASFSDVDDGDSLTYAVSGSLPEGLSLNSATGVLTGTAVNDVAKTSFDVTATDSGGLTVTQSFNLSVVSAPVVDAMAIKGTSDQASGVTGDNLTITLSVSEAFTLDTTNGSPTIEIVFGDSSTKVTATYVSNDGKNLVFTAAAPAGNSDATTLSTISLNGATLVGNVSSQPFVTSATGQTVEFLLDNAGPVFTSSNTAMISEYTPAGEVVYQSSASDASEFTYSLAVGSSSAVVIDGQTGAVKLVEMPVHSGATSYNFTVVATDTLGNLSNNTVNISVDPAEEISGPGVLQQGGISIVDIDNGDGTYTLQFFVAEDQKANFGSGIGSIDLVFNYKESDFEAITAADISSYFSIATPNVETAGKIVFGGLDLTPYNVNSTEPLMSINVTPTQTSNIQVSLTDVIFDVTDMQDTVVVYGDPTIITGAASSDAYMLIAGDAEITTGAGADILVLSSGMGDAFYVTDFEVGSDTIEFGHVLTQAGYVDAAETGATVANNVIAKIETNPSDVLALISNNGGALDNSFGIVATADSGIAKLYYDADAQAGSVDIESFDLNIGQAASTISSLDIVGNFNPVTAPVVRTMTVADGTAPTTAGASGESLTITLGMSEAFTLDTTNGLPTIDVVFGDGGAKLSATYVSNNGSSLVFSLTTPDGNADKVVLDAISLNGATLTGDSSGEAWATSFVGQSAAYSLDNTSPVITSSATAVINEYLAIGNTVYTATATDVSTVTYSLAASSDAALSIDSDTGAVSLNEMPVSAGATQYSFGVVATDALGNSSSKNVTLNVAAAQVVSGPGVLQQGGISVVDIDNGDGTYTLQFFVADDQKANFGSGIGSLDLVFNYTATDFETIAATDVSSYFSIATANVETSGKVVFGGLDLTPYNVASTEPLIEILVTPTQTTDIQISVTDVIFDVTDMADTVIAYGDPTIVSGAATSDAYLLEAGDAEITTGAGADVLVLTDTTGDAFYITDFVSGSDSIEFGSLLSSLGYTSTAESGSVSNGVAQEMTTNASDILALITASDSSLDNMYGAAKVVDEGVAKLFFDADPTVGNVNIQTFDLNIGAAIVDLDDGDISGFIA